MRAEAAATVKTSFSLWLDSEQNFYVHFGTLSSRFFLRNQPSK